MRYVSRIILGVVLLLATQVQSVELFSWDYLHVIDGDTLMFKATWSPLPDKTIAVRILGVDTAESGHRAQCDEERDLALKAKHFVQEVMKNAKHIQVQPVSWDKWGGRIVSIVWCDHKSLGEMLLEKGLARPYDGGKKSSWCQR